MNSGWKILKSQDQWIYKWDPSNTSILVSNLIYIWGQSYTDTEIIDQTPANFKSNSLDQIKDLLSSLLSKAIFTPEVPQELILKGQLPLSYFVFTWTFTLPRLDQSQFYQHLTLPLLQILKSTMPLNDSKFIASLDKSLKQKNLLSLFETDLVTRAFERLDAPSAAAPKDSRQLMSQESLPETQDYEANLKKSLSKKKRKSLFS